MGLEEIGALTPIIAIINNKKKKYEGKNEKGYKTWLERRNQQEQSSGGVL